MMRLFNAIIAMTIGPVCGALAGVAYYERVSGPRVIDAMLVGAVVFVVLNALASLLLEERS
jgi:hypothetical protein